MSFSEQIEKALRAKFDENEVTMKAYRNASNLVNNYIEVNHENMKVGIGFDNTGPLPNNNEKGKGKKDREVPHVLKDVARPCVRTYNS